MVSSISRAGVLGWCGGLLAAAALCTTARTANADPPPPDEVRLDPEQRRDPAEFRGRGKSPDAAIVLSWIPRVVFFPVYVVTEYAVRKPIYAVAGWADRHHVGPIIDEILNPTPDFSWSPTISLDLGAITFVGLQARIGHLPGHELRVAGRFGDVDAWQVKGKYTGQPSDYGYVGVRGDYMTRWDRPFFGLGPYSRDYRTNFSLARGDAFAFGGVKYKDNFRLEAAFGYRNERTFAGGDPSIETRFSPASIPGYQDQLHLAMAVAKLEVDSRSPPDENSGLRFEATGTYARDIQDVERVFATAEADIQAGIEVSYPDRVLVLRAYGMDTFPLAPLPVPFTHLAALGSGLHYGFVWGRFRGDSALLGEVRYRYPIQYFVDMQWVGSVGNVFARDFSDFTLGALTGSIGVGLRTRRTEWSPIELTFALGTSRFDEPFSFKDLRVFLSTTDGL